MIIYGSTMSPFVRKTVAVLREKDLEFSVKGVQFADPNPDFRAASPLGKMPAMDDDGFLLADSSAIVHYLDTKYPEPRLIPEDAEARGRTIWYEEFGDTVLAACVGKIFFNRIVAPVFLQREGDEQVAKDAAANDLPKACAYLEEIVPEPGAFLVGDAVTLADLAVASPFVNFSHAGENIDGNRFPRTAAWVETIIERPSMADSISRERALLEKLGVSA